ncbi:MAG: SH3 domain-containing protein [Candidatus Omnitrophota bacterium]
MLALFLGVLCFSLQAEELPFIGVVNSDNINVRADATVGSAVICTLNKSSKVEVVSLLYGWYKIRLPDSAPSYVTKSFLECDDKCVSAKVTGERVNIRSGPGQSHWIIGKLNKGTIVNVLSQEQGWYRIVPIHESYGWINAKFVSPSAEVQPAVTKKPPEIVGLVVLEGTVRPYGVVLWRKATHKLLTQDKGVYLLKGNKKGLDALVDSKVKITGKLLGPAHSPAPVLEVSKIEAVN